MAAWISIFSTKKALHFADLLGFIRITRTCAISSEGSDRVGKNRLPSNFARIFFYDSSTFHSPRAKQPNSRIFGAIYLCPTRFMSTVFQLLPSVRKDDSCRSPSDS